MVCGGGAKRQIDTATYSLPRKDNCIFALLYLICYNKSAKLLQSADNTVRSDIIMRPCAQKSVRAFCRSLATSMWSLF